MRGAFLGDIHGNYDALQAVLAQVDLLQPDRIFCLGDVVGYGAEPDRCIAAVRERGITTVAGNHDMATCGRFSVEYFNDEARRSVEWTQSHISLDDMTWLSALPLVHRDDGFSLVHSTPACPEAFNYIMTVQDAERSFDAMAQPLALVAHSHVPVIFLERDGDVDVRSGTSATLPERARAIVNVGSVGQPRDQAPQSAFCLLDTDARTVDIRRIPYDIQSCARKILAAGLPAINAYRLFVGQ